MRLAKRGLVAGVLIASAILSLAFPQPAAAAPGGNFRLLLHGTKRIQQTPWGVAGWVLAPNVVRAPNKWLAVVGPRYWGEGFWLELNGGFIVQDGTLTELVDLRAAITQLAPLTFWTNWQWIDFSEGRGAIAYAYLQTDVVLPGEVVAVGIETENFFKGRAKDDLSVGPHLVVIFEKLAFVAAYQIHIAGKDQFWFRIIVTP